MKEGESIDLSVLDDQTLVSVDGKPFINNSNNDGRRFIPMTEIFEANIPARGVNQDMKYKLEHALFLTRTLSKFEFTVDVDKSAESYGKNGMRIKQIKISGSEVS